VAELGLPNGALVSDESADPERVRQSDSGSLRLRGTYQSPVLPSRSMGLPSRGKETLVEAEAKPRGSRHTLAGGNHIVVLVLSQGREANVRDRSGMAVARKWHVLPRSVRGHVFWYEAVPRVNRAGKLGMRVARERGEAFVRGCREAGGGAK